MLGKTLYRDEIESVVVEGANPGTTEPENTSFYIGGHAILLGFDAVFVDNKCTECCRKEPANNCRRE